MDWNRESLTTVLVGTGGAWMLGLALLNPGARRMSSVQRRGLALSGIGFLLSASAARWLQGYGKIGVACSLAGTVIAMTGMYQLVKERAARRAAAVKPKSQE